MHTMWMVGVSRMEGRMERQTIDRYREIKRESEKKRLLQKEMVSLKSRNY